MNLKIKAEEWKNVVEATKGFRDEALLEFRDRGILIRVHDESNTGLYNCLIPKEATEEYSSGNLDRMGFHVDDMSDIVPSSDEVILIEHIHDDGNYVVSVGGRQYKTPNIAPDMVEGVPDKVPSNLSFSVTIKNDSDWLLDFIKDSYDYVFNKSGGSFWMSANEGVLVLWASKDDYELRETFHWEDFTDYNVDWDEATPDKDKSMSVNPNEEKRIEVLMSIPLTKNMKFFTDNVVIEFGHGMPIKAVSETEEGIKHSWIVPPRFPKQTGYTKVPDDVIPSRELKV